jgi:hypothetical protein
MSKLELNLGIKSGFPTKIGGLPVQKNSLPTVFSFYDFFNFFE